MVFRMPVLYIETVWAYILYMIQDIVSKIKHAHTVAVLINTIILDFDLS